MKIKTFKHNQIIFLSILQDQSNCLTELPVPVPVCWLRSIVMERLRFSERNAL